MAGRLELPFLYQTRTLLRRPKKALGLHRRPASTQQRSEDPTGNGAHRPRYGENPYLGARGRDNTKDTGSGTTISSTITASEKRAFEAILRFAPGGDHHKSVKERSPHQDATDTDIDNILRIFTSSIHHNEPEVAVPRTRQLKREARPETANASLPAASSLGPRPARIPKQCATPKIRRVALDHEARSQERDTASSKVPPSSSRGFKTVELPSKTTFLEGVRRARAQIQIIEQPETILRQSGDNLKWVPDQIQDEPVPNQPDEQQPEIQYWSPFGQKDFSKNARSQRKPAPSDTEQPVSEAPSRLDAEAQPEFANVSSIETSNDPAQTGSSKPEASFIPAPRPAIDAVDSVVAEPTQEHTPEKSLEESVVYSATDTHPSSNDDPFKGSFADSATIETHPSSHKESLADSPSYNATKTQPPSNTMPLEEPPDYSATDPHPAPNEDIIEDTFANSITNAPVISNALEDATQTAVRNKLQSISAALEASVRSGDKIGDIALWETIEAEIFSMAKHFQSPTSKPRKEQPFGGIKKFTFSKEKSDFPPQMIEVAERERRIASTDAAAPNPTSASTDGTTEPLPSESLQVLQNVYPAALLLALRLYITHFPSSPYPFLLLPRIRSLGTTSYVLGASSQFYNSLLSLVWLVRSSLRELDDLLREMERGGVNLDEGTYAILSGIEEERTADLEREKRKSEESVLSEAKLSRGAGWWKRQEQMLFFPRVLDWLDEIAGRLAVKERERMSEL